PAAVGAARGGPSRGTAAVDSLDAAGRALFEALREWRRDRARADGVPPYVVLSDAHLAGVARSRPRTPVALSRCDGIGPTKLDRYGEEILEVVERVDPPQ